MSTSTTNAHLATIAVKDPRWAAVLARDPEAKFYYSVKMTGVYCRPCCAAGLARPENVQFYRTCEDAENAGFRPCKRCKPNQASLVEQHAEKIASACRLIERSETPPSLQLPAQNAGMSTYHFHRVFEAATGLTPKGYAAAHRANLVRKSLNKSDTVTEAICDAGYNSNSRFYETSNRVLGMTPSKYRAGGTQTDIRFAVGECSLGSTASYADVARLIGAPNSVRAVAQACGANTLAVAIPCHRVVRSDGASSGYRWGVERKRTLLEKEADA